MKNIIICEGYDWIELSNENKLNSITKEQFNELQSIMYYLNLDQECIFWGNQKFRIINYVGYIQCDTFSLEILPKISIAPTKEKMREILLVMLNECEIIDLTISELSDLELLNGSLYEIFARLYAENLLEELHRGVIQKYKPVQDNLMSLKGALIVSEHAKRNMSGNQKYRVYCEYEERIIDHEINQIFIAANHILKSSIFNFDTLKMLKNIEYILDGVERRIFYNYELDKIQLDRTNNRYEHPLILAKQFIRNVTGSFTHSDNKSFTILFKINDLFEAYIGNLIKKNVERPVFIQDNKYRLLINEDSGRDIFQLKPDVVIDDPGKIIIDTKWKTVSNINRSGVKREDLFQMYAYLTRYEEASVAILIFPENEMIDKSKTYLESWNLAINEDKKIRVHCITLEKRDSTIQELIEIISVR